MTIPNFITLFRLLLIPVFVGALLYYKQGCEDGGVAESARVIALVVFLVAAASDALDGWLARRLRQQSRLGAMLDPLADKALMIAALVLLGFVQMPGLPALPIWFPVLVLGKDGILLAGYLVLDRTVRNVKVIPHWTGKAATALQMAVVVGVLIRLPHPWLYVMIVAAGVLTLASLSVYLWRGCRDIQSSNYG